MTDDRKHVCCCETCGKLIYEGDQYQPCGDGVSMCPDHAATLGDSLAFWEEDVANADRDFAAWPERFDTIEEAEAYVVSLRAQIERDGADHKILTIA